MHNVMHGIHHVYTCTSVRCSHIPLSVCYILIINFYCSVTAIIIIFVFFSLGLIILVSECTLVKRMLQFDWTV